MSDVVFAEPPQAPPNTRAQRAAQDFIDRLVNVDLAGCTSRIEATLQARGSFELLLSAESMLRAAWPTELIPVPQCEIIWTRQSDDRGRALLLLCAFDRSGRALVRTQHVLCEADSWAESYP
jgi:hypothetical protein